MRSKEDCAKLMAERIKLLAKEKHISLQYLYAKFELSTNTLYYLQKKAIFPQIEKMIKLADYFEVTLDYLVGRADNNYYFTNDSELAERLNQAKAMQELLPEMLKQVKELEEKLNTISKT